MTVPDDGCELCGLVPVSSSPGRVFLRGPHAIAVVGRFRHPGQVAHALVLPTAHVTSLHAVPDELAGPLMSTVAAAARTVQQVLGASGTSIEQHNGPPGQDMAHLHLHVVPRWIGDGGIDRGWEPVDADEVLQLAQRLRDAPPG